MILVDILSFSQIIDASAVAGMTLWALAFYWSFSQIRQYLLNTAMKGLGRIRYTPESEPEKPFLNETQRELWASIFSIVPFLIGGGLCYYGIMILLSESWAFSFGLMGAIISSIYDLARSSGVSR